MEKQTVYIAFTMDVEPILEISPGGGPPSWEDARHSISSYAQVLNEKNYKATYFVVPSAASPLSKILLELKQKGNEIGYHLHINSLKDNYKQPEEVKPLGCYTYEEQVSFLREGLKELANGLSLQTSEIHSFRGGYFSSNHDTPRALLSLGITSGSLTLPGRTWKQACAYYKKAPQNVHFLPLSSASSSSPSSKQFVNVPVTSRTNVLGLLAKYGDIRFERKYNAHTLKYMKKAIIQSLKWQKKHSRGFYHLCFFTHDTVDFGEQDLTNVSSNPLIKRHSTLVKLLEQLPSILDSLNLKPSPKTISEIAELFRERI